MGWRHKRFVNGKWLDGSLHGVLHIPELRTNLFIIRKAADKGVVTIYHKDKCEMAIHEGKEGFASHRFSHR